MYKIVDIETKVVTCNIRFRSSLPFPEPENYEVWLFPLQCIYLYAVPFCVLYSWPHFYVPFQAFLTQLVCNLLDEGNACFRRDGDCRQAAQQYGEGISVARYAQAEALIIPHKLLEGLYVNRAAAFYQIVRGIASCTVLRSYLRLEFFSLHCLVLH